MESNILNKCFFKWIRVNWKFSEIHKDWGQEEKRATEDKKVGWHHWLNGYEYEQTPGDSEGQGRLGCCSPWGRKELEATEQQKSLEKMTSFHRTSTKNLQQLSSFGSTFSDL